MASVRRGRSSRTIDWGTPSGIDPDTPVADLHDPEAAGRDSFVLFSDEERERLAWVLDRAERYREVLAMRTEKRRWHETLIGRVALIAGAIAALGTMFASWASLFIHR